MKPTHQGPSRSDGLPTTTHHSNTVVNNTHMDNTSNTINLSYSTVSKNKQQSSLQNYFMPMSTQAPIAVPSDQLPATPTTPPLPQPPTPPLLTNTKPTESDRTNEQRNQTSQTQLEPPSHNRPAPYRETLCAEQLPERNVSH